MLDGALQWNNSIEFEKFLNDFFIKYYFPTYDSEFDAGMNDCSLTTFLCELLRHDSECVNNNPLFSNNNCTYFVDINIINNLNIMFEYLIDANKTETWPRIEWMLGRWENADEIMTCKNGILGDLCEYIIPVRPLRRSPLTHKETKQLNKAYDCIANKNHILHKIYGLKVKKLINNAIKLFKVNETSFVLDPSVNDKYVSKILKACVDQ